jgi:hypothetical protein
MMLAACASAQPFTNLASGAIITTNITSISSSGQFVKVRLSNDLSPALVQTSALEQDSV